VANPSLHLKTVEDVVALAKKMNGKLAYASPGIGTGHHVFAEYFRQVAGINLIHVPYKGTAPALLDVMSGQVAIMVTDLLPALPLIQSGKLTVIAVTSAKGNPSMPDIPTIAETYPGYLGVGWEGVVAPSGTPDDIIRKLSETLSSFVSRPETAEKLHNLGVDAKPSSPGEMGEWINSQLQQWQVVVKNAGISPE
jgi:tripartite-type tricarboxylate transporter receptor subunit TctC